MYILLYINRDFNVFCDTINKIKFVQLQNKSGSSPLYHFSLLNILFMYINKVLDKCIYSDVKGLQDNTLACAKTMYVCHCAICAYNCYVRIILIYIYI